MTKIAENNRDRAWALAQEIIFETARFCDIFDQREAAANLIEGALRPLEQARMLCARQAEDHGLWFRAATAPEAYLQQALRALHKVVENDE